jgi:hypothetical protein
MHTGAPGGGGGGPGGHGRRRSGQLGARAPREKRRGDRGDQDRVLTRVGDERERSALAVNAGGGLGRAAARLGGEALGLGHARRLPL